MTRSATAFARGARTGASRVSMPSAAARLREVAPVDGVPIAEQEARPAAPRGGLDQLAPDPGGGRVRGDVHVHQLAPAVGDEHEHVERLERQRLDRAQVRRPDRAGVVGEERAPGLARRAGGAAPPVALDRALADGDPQLEQLAPDALAAPARVVPRHRGDQLADLGAQARPPEPRAGPPAPEEPPALPVPADDGLRPHEDAGAGASRARARGPAPRRAGRACGAAAASGWGGSGPRAAAAAGGSPPPARRGDAGSPQGAQPGGAGTRA